MNKAAVLDEIRNSRAKLLGALEGLPEEAMLRAGVVGYVAKGRIGSTLGDVVCRVHEGEVVLAAPTAVRVLRRLMQKIPAQTVIKS